MNTKRLTRLGALVMGYAALSGLPLSEAETTPTVTILAPSKAQKEISQSFDYFHQVNASKLSYVMLDKPLYQPGEAVWFRVDLRQTSTLLPAKKTGATVELLDPKGAVVGTRRVEIKDGIGANDFILSEDAPGGEYILRVTPDDEATEQRKFNVARYEAPRLKKSLEFLRKAYSPGAEVSAAVQVSLATGEVFAKKKLTSVVIIDGSEVSRTNITTDAEGNALVKFTLPAKMKWGDGLLTILADDGGVTESIQRRIPIVMKQVQVSTFPEGGMLVESLPGRVYFSAINTLGKPADIEGRVIDNNGKEITTFRTLRDGMGRFDLTPSPGNTYFMEITKPEGSTPSIGIPWAEPKGCTLITQDDFSSKSSAIKATVTCTEKKTLFVEATLREKHMNAATFSVEPNTPSLLKLEVGKAQGAMRVTLFDENKEPLAERLVYRGREQSMKVDIKADKQSYAPRDKVTLTLTTLDADNKPIEANVGLSVVDDTVLSFADDKTANLVAHLFLESDLGVVSLEDPNFYFSKKPEAAQALDLVMGTKGYRRFEWAPIIEADADYDGIKDPADKCPIEAETFNEYLDTDGCPEKDTDEDGIPDGKDKCPTKAEDYWGDVDGCPAPPSATGGMGWGMGGGFGLGLRGVGAGGGGMGEGIIGGLGGGFGSPFASVFGGDHAELGANANAQKKGKGKAKLVGNKDDKAKLATPKEAKKPEAAPEEAVIDPKTGYHKVRVFPQPSYKPGEKGVRDDFRETVYWAPKVKTNAQGKATVSFYLSDSITSFKATAEGFSAKGTPGRGEFLLQSKLPLSLDAVMPLEVSEGDQLNLPVTLTNTTNRTLSATLTAEFGKAFSLQGDPAKAPISLKPGEKRAIFFPLTVVSKGLDTEGGEISFVAEAEGLEDELSKKIKVTPLGFPFERSYSGTVKDRASQEVDLSLALPGSADAKVTLYPSVLASISEGTEGILREPSGCFEQTSSSNYPNVMVMQYMKENEAVDPALWTKAQGLMTRGYQKLVSFETKEKGYEWFGGTPAHEALTAYGLMEFVDMARLDDQVDPKMIERTVKWLLSRRDGKGGYKRSEQALDSFGRASPETTNAYITWALSEAKKTSGLETELEYTRKLGNETQDPYLVALSTNTLLNVSAKSPDGSSLAKRLAGMQAKDGSFTGAKESITKSGGASLTIEATSLAVLALIKASPNREYDDKIRKAVEWLNTQRNGWGQWGNTQGTILSLKALTAFTQYSRAMQSSGTVSLLIDGEEVRSFAFEAGHKDPIVFDRLNEHLSSGTKKIEVKLNAKAALPYSMVVTYRMQKPTSDEGVAVELETELAKKEVKMGESVRMKAHLVNTSGHGLPMTLIRMGLPGGLTFQSWQLKELKEKGIIGFYETREREVILYFRALPEGAKVDIELDLIARTPGTFVSPPSTAYLYYTNEQKSWAPATTITVKQ